MAIGLKRKIYTYQRSFGGGVDQKGDPNSKKIGSGRIENSKFSAPNGAGNFARMKGFSRNLALFWSLRGKFGQIWINMVILN